MNATAIATMRETDYAGKARLVTRPLAIECPVAIEVNGVAYAVMMATPSDLEDYAAGFALSETMIGDVSEIAALSLSEIEQGAILRLTLCPDRAAPLLERVRMRVAEGSCGLCGLESISQVLRPLVPLPPSAPIAEEAVERALHDFATHQHEGARTGAMHAAAFCSPSGEIRLIREDVGRHNALDKLIGALGWGGMDPASGFILVSARCSYELVEKAVLARCPTLVAISAPTSLAVERARQAGLRLIALARSDTMLVIDAEGEAEKELVDGL